ncbi:MAG: adenylosuccinate lyase [Candidatus Omnitrophota bacterium]
MISRYSLPQMANIWEDENKFRIMLDIELLALEAYAIKKEVPKEAVSRIKRKADFRLSEISRYEEKTQHDIIAFLHSVSKRLGPDAQYLHKGLTSSDLLDTTLSVQLVQAADILIDDLKRLLSALFKKAKKYRNTPCIGRTHGVHAEPVTFGLKMALWYDETQRNLERLIQARQAVSWGKLSGAVGTYSNIDLFIEQYVCRKLKLKPARIATQVIQRDVYAEFMTVLAIIASCLEQFATEIRHLQKTEVREAEEPFGKGQKGSSAMPHKRNPVICERVCGLARIVRANAIVSLENISLWHERDISHSSAERVTMPDSTIALDYMLNKFIQVIDGLLVYPDNMMANLIKTKGLIFSQRVLVTLMNKGMKRQLAYDLVQKNAMSVWQHSLDFKQTLSEDKQVSRALSKQELDKIFSLDYYLRNVNKIFNRLGL